MKLTLIDLEDTISRPERYNDNKNLIFPSFEKEISEEEWDRIVTLTGLSKWINLKHDVHTYKYIPVSIKEMSLILDIMNSTIITGNILPSHIEDLDFLRIRFEEFEKGKEWFVRMEYCSLKDSIHEGPIKNYIELIKSLLTSHRAKACLTLQSQYEDQVWLTLMPYNNKIDPKREFRCSVYRGNITSISQYVWHKDVGWSQKQDELKRIVANIIEFNRNLDKSKLPESYVLDVYANNKTSESKDEEIELVEFNPFGAQMSSGSALFSWVHDQSQMYGGEEEIEVRIAVKINEN